MKLIGQFSFSTVNIIITGLCNSCSNMVDTIARIATTDYDSKQLNARNQIVSHAETIAVLLGNSNDVDQPIPMPKPLLLSPRPRPTPPLLLLLIDPGSAARLPLQTACKGRRPISAHSIGLTRLLGLYVAVPLAPPTGGLN